MGETPTREYPTVYWNRESANPILDYLPVDPQWRHHDLHREQPWSKPVPARELNQICVVVSGVDITSYSSSTQRSVYSTCIETISFMGI